MGRLSFNVILPLSVAVLVIGPAVRRAMSAGAPERVREWAAAAGLELTAENAVMVAAYRRRSGRCRAVGTLFGLALALLIGNAVDARVYGAARPGGNIGFVGMWVFLSGYLVGILAGELATQVPVPGHRRSAGLTPRRLEEYAPRRALRWIDAGAAASAVVAVVFLVLPMRHAAATGRLLVAVIPSLAAVAFALATRSLVQLLLNRPRAQGDPAVVAAHDAIRSTGIRAVLAASVVMVATNLAVELFALCLTDVTALRWAGWVPAVLVFVLAYRAWRSLVEPGGWRVRRQAARPLPA